jgi:hypothetical protein
MCSGSPPSPLTRAAVSSISRSQTGRQRQGVLLDGQHVGAVGHGNPHVEGAAGLAPCFRGASGRLRNKREESDFVRDFNSQ